MGNKANSLKIEEEMTNLSRFDTENPEQLVASYDSAEKELELLENVINFINSSRDLQSIVAKLRLEDFCHGQLSLDVLINNINGLEIGDYGENLSLVLEVADGLKGEKCFYFEDKFKEILKPYIKPATVQERKIDDKLVVEVTGKHIVVSQILSEIVNKLCNNPKVEGVLFVASDVVHVDTNLKGEVWQGKNLVILTEAIIVDDQITWDVSGKDNDHTYSDNAGTEETGQGKSGADGYSGESGGNVFIQAETLEHPENFTIISNGGKGSRGQDGGKGKDGENGKGITKIEFDEKFPPTAKTLSKSRRANVIKTVSNIQEDSQSIICQWYAEKKRRFGFGKYEITDTMPDVLLQKNYTENNISMFIHAMTHEGNEIIYSFQHAEFTTACQAFLLYKGTIGHGGGHGGEYGFGGQGGFDGEIIVGNPTNTEEFNVIKETKQGTEGENGQAGLCGKHGENGWDMGYSDYMFSRFFCGKWPKFYGTEQNSKIELKYYPESSSNRIYCPYKKHKGDRNVYAELEHFHVEHRTLKTYEKRTKIRQSSERQTHALAVRKTNLSQTTVLANYNHHLNSMEQNTLQNLRTELRNAKQEALQKVVEHTKLQQTQTKVKCLSTNQNNCQNNDIFLETNCGNSQGSKDVGDFISKLEDESFLLKNWLQPIEPNWAQLNTIFTIFEDQKRIVIEENLKDVEEINQIQRVEKILIDKYRLATLQVIANQLPPIQEVSGSAKLLPENTAKFLVEAKVSHINVSHAALGTLNEYLYDDSQEQRDIFLDFLLTADKFQNKEKIFKKSIITFVLEEGKLAKESNSGVNIYYTKYEDFLKKQKHKLDLFLEPFQRELSRPANAEVYELLIKSIKDKSQRCELERKIRQEPFLSVLYDRFIQELKQKFDWNECCTNDVVLKEYNNHIYEKGRVSESYLVLLAYIFNVNIRVYVENQDNEICLKSDQNPLAKQIIHILCRNNKFVQMNIDDDYLNLDENRKMKEKLYGLILARIKTLKQKQDVDEFFNNKVFPSLKSPLEVEQPVSEELVVENILEYFPAKEKEKLKERLENIKSRYIGQHEILHYMLKRFTNEGRQVSSQELCCLLNSILACVDEDRKEFNIFCWIVAAHPQKCWTDELLLLQLETHFRKQLLKKSEWRKYLSNIENKNLLLLMFVRLDQRLTSNPISVQCIDDILRFLSTIPNETVNLEGIELSEWPYALKEKYLTFKLSKLVVWHIDDLPKASYYFLSMENIYGASLTQDFMITLETKTQELSSDTLTFILSHFHNENWNLTTKEIESLARSSVHEWIQEMQQQFTSNGEDRQINHLVELIKANSNTSGQILSILPAIQNQIAKIDEHIISMGNFQESKIQKWLKQIHSKLGKLITGEEKTLARIYKAIEFKKASELKREFKLRDTQKLTASMLLKNGRSTLAQVSTGEGKSLIIVAIAIMKALRGERVHILSSSSVLAKRDAEDNKDIYKLFGINVTHNCCELIEKRKEVYAGNQVIYGDLANFQRDYLLDTFWGKNILGPTKFENVIVDEVDSMLLDKGNNMLYLSNDLAGLDKLESVYIYIWQYINRPASDLRELDHALDAQAIKEAVISDIFGLLKTEDIDQLGPDLSESQKTIMWKRLIEAKIIDNQGKLLIENLNEKELNQVISSEFSCYKDRLQFLLKTYIERDKFIHVPNNLKPFIERHLESWIESALTAFFMNVGEDYIVDVDRTGSSPDRNANIIILDRDTGTDQANSQWDEALNQFLQLKHGCKLSLQSLKSVFISNVSFFKLYTNLYGLTGTLGSQRERDLLKEIHDIDFVTIPTSKSKRFHEETPILCRDKREWIDCIHSEAKQMTVEKKRSVLIICETINDVNTVRQAFESTEANQVHTYTRDYEAFDTGLFEENQELRQGQTIIATNLAGRGTDIKLSDGLKQAGGLHVCLTYLPGNLRVEQQAFGRSARNGDRGSGQLIIIDSKGQENKKILDLKKQRDADELLRISDIKSYYDRQIVVEESCFKAFQGQYDQLKKELVDKKVPSDVQEILLRSCLDKWTFWIDEHNKCLRQLTDEHDKKSIQSKLKEFISQLENLDTGYNARWEFDLYGTKFRAIEHNSTSWVAWVEGNWIQMIKLGKYLSQNEQLENAHQNAIKLFEEVIRKEPHYSEAARYYKAFALIKKIGDEKVFEEFKQELEEVARLLDEHSKFAITAAGIVGKIKKNNDKSIVLGNAFEEQQKSLANLYYIFSRSIDDIFGRIVTPESFVNHDINEHLAEGLYNDLLERCILEKPKVEFNIDEKKLNDISSSYGAQARELKQFIFKYKGKEINEKEFLMSLKKDIVLPHRKAFWKFLIQTDVLNEEVKYVRVDINKLNEIDPSLADHLTKIKQKELKQQSLEPSNEEILLNAEWVKEHTKAEDIFQKDDFIKIVGRVKYKVLKEKQVLTFNRKAHINQRKIESTRFPCYDSITLEDITKIGITKSDAEIILAELVKTKVLEKNDSTYGLKITFNEIHQIELLPCPVYEDVVKRLLSVCFTYRIVLQKMVWQIEEKNDPICLPLTTAPHQSLFFELVQQKLIRPTMVTITDEDVKEKLKDMYSQTMTEHKFQLLLCQDKLVPKECTEELIECLIEKKWIVKTGNNYSINNPDKRLDALNFNPKRNHDNELTNIDKTVAKILDNRLQLAGEATINNIVCALQRSKSLIKALKAPDGNLKPLTDLYVDGHFANMEELHVFLLNGLDHLLQLQEMKWTGTMLLNCAGVVLLGVSQIAVGVAIELYSCGIMTHVGGAFINEGANDLIFAAGALMSGYFSWRDYRKQKVQSLMCTVITGGVGAYLSRGSKVSYFGYKLAGPNYQFGKKVSEMTGKELIKVVSGRVIGKEIIKRISYKTGEALILGVTLTGVDLLVENYLTGLCDGIGSTIFTNIERTVAEHSIAISLEKTYKLLGREKTKKLIDDLTNCVLDRQNYESKYFSYAKKIASSVSQGIGAAIQKTSKTNAKWSFPIQAINKLVSVSGYSKQVHKIATMSNSFLNELEKDLKATLKKKENALEGDPNQTNDEDYESFKKEVTDQWKSMLGKNAGQIIKQHIVTPILQAGANHVVRWAGRKVQELYQSYEEESYLNQLGQIREEYQKQKQIAKRTGQEIDKRITEQYVKRIQKIQMKTRNPQLYANILQQDVPIDIVGIMACCEVFQKTIIVEGEDGTKQTFSPSSGISIGEEINIKLVGEHYSSSESSTTQYEGRSDAGNNCFQESLMPAIPELRDMPSKEFRAMLAFGVENSQSIRYHIEQGWHSLPLSHKFFGGRQSAELWHDPESSSSEDGRITAEANHLVDRFLRYFGVGGTIEYISEQTNLIRDEIVEDGASQFQDRTGTRDHPACHVNRLRIVLNNREKMKIYFKYLKDRLGHTQFAPRWCNDWHGIGGDFDKLQSKLIKVLNKIDFKRSLTAEDAILIQNIKDNFTGVLDNRINSGKYDERKKEVLVQARDAFIDMSIESLHEQGKKGYSNAYIKYGPKRRR